MELVGRLAPVLVVPDVAAALVRDLNGYVLGFGRPPSERPSHPGDEEHSAKPS